MKIHHRVIAMVVIMLAVTTVQAIAVGYEPVVVNGSSQSESGVRQASPNWSWSNSFLKNYPTFIDEVAATVRDVLSQFGLSPRTSR
ncbi:hypothetical protein ACFL2Q_19425 [Thermodesulfobacteriota bacterium]